MNKNIPNYCFECGDGAYQKVTENYQVELPDGNSLTISDLSFYRCDHCGEELIPPASSRRIDAEIDHCLDTLAPEFVRTFLGHFKIDQTEAAEALGMGKKTVHRWANGSQRVSRSMGYFLRALYAHPEVFDWIRERRWRGARIEDHPDSITMSTGYWKETGLIRFPAISKKREGKGSLETKSYNAANALLQACVQ